jgi:Arc/MetJ family transcription regulator
MRTKIEIVEKLMNEILQKTSIKTKKEVIDIALRQFLRKIKLQELADFRGKIKWEGNLEDMRSNYNKDILLNTSQWFSELPRE